jgi:hypothetical protein
MKVRGMKRVPRRMSGPPARAFKCPYCLDCPQRVRIATTTSGEITFYACWLCQRRVNKAVAREVLLAKLVGR